MLFLENCLFDKYSSKFLGQFHDYPHTSNRHPHAIFTSGLRVHNGLSLRSLTHCFSSGSGLDEDGRSQWVTETAEIPAASADLCEALRQLTRWQHLISLPLSAVYSNTLWPRKIISPEWFSQSECASHRSFWIHNPKKQSGYSASHAVQCCTQRIKSHGR